MSGFFSKVFNALFPPDPEIEKIKRSFEVEKSMSEDVKRRWKESYAEAVKCIVNLIEITGKCRCAGRADGGGGPSLVDIVMKHDSPFKEMDSRVRMLLLDPGNCASVGDAVRRELDRHLYCIKPDVQEQIIRCMMRFNEETISFCRERDAARTRVAKSEKDLIPPDPVVSEVGLGLNNDDFDVLIKNIKHIHDSIIQTQDLKKYLDSFLGKYKKVLAERGLRDTNDYDSESKLKSQFNLFSSKRTKAMSSPSLLSVVREFDQEFKNTISLAFDLDLADSIFCKTLNAAKDTYVFINEHNQENLHKLLVYMTEECQKEYKKMTSGNHNKERRQAIAKACEEASRKRNLASALFAYTQDKGIFKVLCETENVPEAYKEILKL